MAQIFGRSSNPLARISVVRVCQWMVMAKAFDLFRLIKCAARNLHFWSRIPQYVDVRGAPVSFRLIRLCAQLESHPLVPTNAPRLTEILEPEHAHS